MISDLRYRRKSVFGMVILIIFFLVAELLLTYENSNIIVKNENLQKQAEQTKVSTLDVIRNVHLLDLGLRGYAMSSGKMMGTPIDTALSKKDIIFDRLEKSLTELGFPLHDFQALKDSTNAYFDVVFQMKVLIEQDRQKEFMHWFQQDKGYAVFSQHSVFTREVYAFADKISRTAKANYEEAERNIYVLQIIVLSIVLPTLLYTAYFSNRTIALSEKLRESEAEKNTLLSEQNQMLERAVYERTNEILSQNEEIKAQNEEILSHNEQLVFQQNEIELQSSLLRERNTELELVKRVVEEQNLLIREKNTSLSSEVGKQTEDLKMANKELMEQNSRLEQFAYVISHNLRAPIARLIGLTSIVDHSHPSELSQIHQMIQHSSKELDSIVRDLTDILAIQNLSPTLYVQIDFSVLLEKIMSILEKDITDTHTVIESDFKIARIFSLIPYLESIVLNLLSNAIKYRHPDRIPHILIRSEASEEFILLSVTDNGLGIDLEKHRDVVFNLYKRFHFHVEGKGLGLYLVRTQVEALGGRVEIKSDLNKGTTFEIRLPKVSHDNKNS